MSRKTASTGTCSGSKPHRDHLGRRRSKDSKHITYQELHDEVCRLANVLKTHGVKKGDTVTIYLPMIPEAAYAMLACARIGAVHSVVFGGFSPDSLAGRIADCRSKLLITADEGRRGGRTTPLKAHADEAIEKTGGIVETMLVVRHTGGAVAWRTAATSGITRPRRKLQRSALTPR